MPSYIGTGTGDVWDYWTTGTTTLSNTVWIRWIQDGTASSTSSFTSDVWTTWTSASTTAIYMPPERHVRTAEEIAAEEAQRLRWRQEEADRFRVREAAAKRAEDLLVGALSLLQRSQFYKERSFVVEGKNGFRYRIREGRSGNVDMVKPDGTVQHRLCIHPREAVPDCDTMLAQKLLIECDEDHFLKTANRHHVLTPAQRVLEALH